MKYRKISRLQFDVGLDATVCDIVIVCASIEPTPGPLPVCSDMELLHHLYTENGDVNKTVTKTARELGVNRSGIYARRRVLLEKLHDILSVE
ncbi:MAG: hypothetical protein GY841_10180 [FCB group bacterium]|nr:hypothetical protein [FCB group bacterium]